MRTRSDGSRSWRCRQACSRVRKKSRQIAVPSAATDNTNADRGISHNKEEEVQNVPGNNAAAISYGSVFVLGSAQRSSPK